MMTTTTEAIRRVSQATGMTVASGDRLVRALRESSAGLWPKSGFGGGKSAAHVSAADLVNLILGLASEGPKEAVDYVEELRSYRLASEEPPQLPGLFGLGTPKPTFGDYLENWITSFATEAARDATAQHIMQGKTWSILLCRSQGFALITETEKQRESRSLTFYREQPKQTHGEMLGLALLAPSSKINRYSSLPVSLFLLAGSLLEDANQAVSDLLGAPDNENAALGGAASSNQLRSRETLDLNTPKDRRERDVGQGLAPPEAGFLSTKRTHAHGRPHSSDARAA